MQAILNDEVRQALKDSTGHNERRSSEQLPKLRNEIRYEANPYLEVYPGGTVALNGTNAVHFVAASTRPVHPEQVTPPETLARPRLRPARSKG